MLPKALVGLLLLSSPLGGAETEAPPVARMEANVIQRPLEMGFFFRKLRGLEARKGAELRRVNILHLGDSHLQSGLFSKPLRQVLGKRFGLAGRGLIFPFSVARSSNPPDLISESNVPWMSRRSAVAAQPGLEGLDTGAAGFSVMTTDSGYILRLGVRGDDSGFDTVTIFSRRDARAYGMKISTHSNPRLLHDQGLMPRDRLYQVASGDTLSALSRHFGVSLKEIRLWNQLKNDQIFAGDTLVVRKEESSSPAAAIDGFSDAGFIEGGASQKGAFTVRLKSQVSDIFLRGAKGGEAEREAVIYGASVERAAMSGLNYHSVGVNGARLKSFSRSARFLEQARLLDPDLVIIALGTNESMADDDPDDIEENLHALITGFTRHNPKYVAFLVVTPPDVLDWRGRLNPNVAKIASRLRAFASRHGLALWDWNELMGGAGSVLSWRESHLVLSDGVHMNASGYQLQSRLFYQALMDAYERY